MEIHVSSINYIVLIINLTMKKEKIRYSHNKIESFIWMIKILLEELLEEGFKNDKKSL